jgi:FAD/FMN-containing dehydrogenase
MAQNSSVDSTARLTSALAKASIPFHTCSSPLYSQYTRPYNRQFSYKPVGVAIPENEEQVAQAIRAARAVGVKVQALSGGHSYAAHSTGGRDGSLIIDLQKFQKVEMVREGDLVPVKARIGAGVRLGTLATELWEQGGWAVSHGTHPGLVNSPLSVEG